MDQKEEKKQNDQIEQITSIHSSWEIIMEDDEETLVKMPNRPAVFPNDWKIRGFNEENIMISVPKDINIEPMKDNNIEPMKDINMEPIKDINMEQENTALIEQEKVTPIIEQNSIRLLSTWRVLYYKDDMIIIKSPDKQSALDHHPDIGQKGENYKVIFHKLANYSLVILSIDDLKSGSWGYLAGRIEDKKSHQLYDRPENIGLTTYLDTMIRTRGYMNYNMILLPKSWQIVAYDDKEIMIRTMKPLIGKLRQWIYDIYTNINFSIFMINIEVLKLFVIPAIKSEKDCEDVGALPLRPQTHEDIEEINLYNLQEFLLKIDSAKSFQHANPIRIPSSWKVIHHIGNKILMKSPLGETFNYLNNFKAPIHFCRDSGVDIVEMCISDLKSIEWANLTKHDVSMKTYNSADDIPLILYNVAWPKVLISTNSWIEIPEKWNIVHYSNKNIIVKILKPISNVWQIDTHIIYSDSFCNINQIDIKQIQKTKFDKSAEKLYKVNLDSLVEDSTDQGLQPATKQVQELVESLQPTTKQAQPVAFPIFINPEPVDENAIMMDIILQHCGPISVKAEAKNYDALFTMMRDQKYYDKIIQTITNLNDFISRIVIGGATIPPNERIYELNIINNLLDNFHPGGDHTGNIIALFINMNRAYGTIAHVMETTADLLKSINKKIHALVYNQSHCDIYKYYVYIVRFRLDYIMIMGSQMSNISALLIKHNLFIRCNALSTFEAFVNDNGSLDSYNGCIGMMIFESMNYQCNIKFKEVIKSNMVADNIHMAIEDYRYEYPVSKGCEYDVEAFDKVYAKVIEYYYT